MKIAVALSGGVDSAAAAIILQKKHEVFGVTLKLFDDEEFGFTAESGSQKTINDAIEVAKQLNIKHYVLDVSAEFKEIVVKNFINEYKNGKTPNPCTLCNPTIKFGLMLEKAKQLGADKLATGHYIKLSNVNGKKRIEIADYKSKDQSYVLWQLKQNQLVDVIFPLASLTKPEIREIVSNKLPVIAKKPESQDICFIYGHYKDFIKQHIQLVPGDIKHVSGEVLGKHKGLALYTIGQRKGLDTPWIKPLYVKKLNVAKNELIVTDDINDLKKDFLVIHKVNWIEEEFPSIENLEVQVRYNSKTVKVKKLEEVKSHIKVYLAEKVDSITKGQSAVFYKGSVLVGGGIIC